MSGQRRETLAFAMVLAGALCAECIPLAAALIGAAWAVAFRKKGRREERCITERAHTVGRRLTRASGATVRTSGRNR